MVSPRRGNRLGKNVVFILPTRSHIQSAKVDLDLWPRDKNNRVPPLIIHNLQCEVWKWLGENCSRYRVHKVKRDGPTHTLTHAPIHSPNHRRTAITDMEKWNSNQQRFFKLWFLHTFQNPSSFFILFKSLWKLLFQPGVVVGTTVITSGSGTISIARIAIITWHAHWAGCSSHRVRPTCSSTIIYRHA